MQIELSIDNRYLSLCSVKTLFDRKGKQRIANEWMRVEKFIQNSSFPGKQNLIITLLIDDKPVFLKTKVKYKEESYRNVFQLLENFILDKLYFFQKLEEDEKTTDLQQEYMQNKETLTILKRLNKEMKWLR